MFFESRHTARRFGCFRRLFSIYSTPKTLDSRRRPGGSFGSSLLVYLLLSLALPLLVSCGRDNPAESRSAVPVRVVVTPETTDLDSAGQSVRLSAQALDDAGQEISEASVIWRSSDASVAHVSVDGVVTATGEGSVVITAMAGQKTGSARVTVSDPVRAALRALYEATGGANWTNNANWLSDQPLAEWHGVIGEPSGQSEIPQRRTGASGLTRLDLSSNGLTGEIPAELGNLVDLLYLNLSDNELSGAIPPALGNLADLQTLRLHGNRLSGKIPAELGNLDSLRELSLHGNGGLTGPLPLQFANLDHLQTLSLSGTQLCAPTEAAFQNWLAGIASRTGIYNCGNNTDGDRNVLLALYNATDGLNWTNRAHWLSDRPLGEWHGVGVNAEGRVDSLILGNNALNGPLPASLGSLSGLTVLYASDNRLSGSIPEELGNLSGLVYLDLSNNALTGPIPPALFSLPNLVRLVLSGNQFTDIPVTDTPGPMDRDALVALYEATNGANWTNNTHWLSDRPLGEWHGVSTNAEGRVDSLTLSLNNLTGSIPTELGNLASLGILNLARNSLTGSIPIELGNLTSLQYLAFSFNNLTGSIPTGLGNLASLERLSLGNNSLTGTIPPELGSLSNLNHMWLGENQLTGPLPGTFTGLTNLDVLYIEETELCAPPDAAFQAWLRGVSRKRGVVNCSDPTVNPDDHSNTRSGATPLALGSSASGQIETGSDVDYFKVEVGDLGILMVYTTGSLDTQGELQNSSGTRLTSNADGGTGTNFRIGHSVQPGTYYVKVESYQSNIGSYTLHASFDSGNGGGGSGGGTFEVGDALPGVPTSGFFVPFKLVGASVSASGGNTTINFDNGGYIEIQNGTRRYTCRTSGGCEVVNGVVTEGTIASGGGTTVPPPSSDPDLEVQSLSVSDNTLTTRQSFTLRATVRNEGAGRSAATTLRYYRSLDSTISSTDTAVGTDTVRGLAASGTSAESIGLTAPSSTGTYYYGACVDAVTDESDTNNNCFTGVRVTVSGGGGGSVPSHPTGVTARFSPPSFNVGDRVTMIITWNSAPGALNYKVYIEDSFPILYRRLSDGSCVITSSVTRSATTTSTSYRYNFTASLINNYYYLVQACNSSGCSCPSPSSRGVVNMNAAVSGGGQ